MSTITTTSTLTEDHRMRDSRILAIARLHFVNRWTVIYVPAVILGIILLANWTVWWAILSALDTDTARAAAREGLTYSGAAFYIFVYMMIVAVQAINVTFPYALGFGVTRRDFALGSGLAFTVLAAGWAVVLTLLSYLEQATHGWGLGGNMFSTVYFSSGAWFARLAVFFLVFEFFFFVGSAIATLYVRWKARGLVLFFIGLALILLGLIAGTTAARSWPAVGVWLVTNQSLGVAAWSLVPTVLAALAGYLVLRRATPRD